MSTVISIENVSKSYRLGAIGGATLRDDFARWMARLRGRPDPLLKIGQEHVVRHDGAAFWALRGVSFEVRQGEVLGIIGRNGAGKSTLLKILSRVTAPTEGQIRVKGRIASLLEVGTGFHPELTGRENIFLNGAILGMTKAEIRRKFDEIVAFSEIEEFVDTPVKRFSSGMYVRLAFAVAAHLEPEILVVDEVLAVGDAAFQKKCLGKMQDVAGHGRTVLFVSHNMAAVRALCTRAVLLDQGQLQADERTESVIVRYLESGRELSGRLSWPDPAVAPGNEKVRLAAVGIVSDGEVTAEPRIDRDIQVVVDYWNRCPDLPLAASIHLLDKMGVEVLASANLPSANLVHDEWFGRPFPCGLYRSTCTLPANFLNEGRYSIRVALCSQVSHVELLTDDIIAFHVQELGEMRREYSGRWIGVVRPKLAWRTQRLESSEEEHS